MHKLIILLLLFFLIAGTNAQPVEVRVDYNSVGDAEFVAYNNTKAPLFVHILLGDLQNTYYNETLPILKQIEPGYNSLFTLERNLDSNGRVRFHYEIKYYRSNPIAQFDLDFPYLIPFEPGEKVSSFNVKNIDGFMGLEVPESWSATGFITNAGDKILAARTGILVEIVGEKRNINARINYNGWNYSFTILHLDGTLACYRNVVDKTNKLKVGQKVFAGQVLGEVVTGIKEFLLLVYSENLNSDDLVFIIPQFVTGENKTEMIISKNEFTVIHPNEIRNREMTKKEIRKWLK